MYDDKTVEEITSRSHSISIDTGSRDDIGAHPATGLDHINKFVQSASGQPSIKALDFLQDPIDPAIISYGISINGVSLEHMIYDLELRKLLVVLLF